MERFCEGRDERGRAVICHFAGARGSDAIGITVIDQQMMCDGGLAEPEKRSGEFVGVSHLRFQAGRVAGAGEKVNDSSAYEFIIAAVCAERFAVR